MAATESPRRVSLSVSGVRDAAIFSRGDLSMANGRGAEESVVRRTRPAALGGGPRFSSAGLIDADEVSSIPGARAIAS